MKIEAKKLAKALKTVAPTLFKSQPFFKLVADGDKLTISTFDMVSGTQIDLEGEGVEPFVCFVPNKFQPVVNRITGVLELTLDDSSLIVQSKKGTVKVECMPDMVCDLPKVNGSAIAVNRQWLVGTLATVAPFANQDQSKQILQVVRFENKEGMLQLAATDGHRLAMSEEIESEVASMSVLPSIFKALNELTDEEVYVSSDGTLVGIEAPGVKFVTRQVDGAYPAYKMLVPKTFSGSGVFNRQELIEAVQIAIAANLKETILLAVKSDLINVFSSKEAGEVNLNLEFVRSSGSDIEILFNSKFLLEMLNANNGEEVTINWNNNVSPVVFDFLGCQHLLMPLQQIR